MPDIVTAPVRARLPRPLSRLRRDERAVAMIEFAYALPVFLAMALGGIEVTNFVTTKMRVSQLALHVADHAARIGTGTLLASKTIDEAQINDLFTGAGLQAGELDIYGKGRVIISSLEPVASPNATDRYKITWQRCRGSQVHPSSYGVAGQTGMTGMGPAGPPNRQVKAPNDGATMFVEVSYRYAPLIAAKFAPVLQITEIASMVVRDRRDLSDDSTSGTAATHPYGVYKVAGVVSSTC